jgi:TPP-dependent pyruvate/acetoin dehydrogenase alpha subunit
VLHEAGVEEARLEQIADDARADVERAIEFALASPKPEGAAAFEDVYAPSDWNADGRLA